MNQGYYQPGKLWSPELAAVLFVISMGYFAGAVITPILPLFLSENGMGGSTIGILSAGMMVGIAISEFFWGWVVDRWDLRILIFVGSVMLGLMIFGLSFSKGLTAMAVALFFVGFCRSPNFIVGRWFMSIYAPIRQKALAMAILSTVIGMVDSAGSFTSGFLSEGKGFQITFHLAGGLAISAGLLVLIFGKKLNFRKHKEIIDLSEYEKPEPVKIGREIKIATIGMGLIGMLYYISFGIFATYLPLLASNVVGTTTSQVGTLFGIRGLISTAALIPIGRMIDKKDKWIFLPLSFLLIALSMISIGSAQNYLWLLIGAAFFALGASIYSPSINSILSHSVPVSWMGTAYGIFGFLEDTGWMLGPAIGGLLWETVSQPSTFFFAAFATLLAVPLVLLHKKRVIESTNKQVGFVLESIPGSGIRINIYNLLIRVSARFHLRR